MKKYILISVLIVACLGAGYYILNHKSTPEYGDIGVVENDYIQLSGYAWNGDVSDHKLYIVFKPNEYNDAISPQHECTIFEEVEGCLLNDSFYMAHLENGEIWLEYSSGEIEEDFRGHYTENSLEINGSTMEGFDPNSLEHRVYGFGKYPEPTPGV